MFELFFSLTWTSCSSVWRRVMLYRERTQTAIALTVETVQTNKPQGQRSLAQCCYKERLISAKILRHLHDTLWRWVLVVETLRQIFWQLMNRQHTALRSDTDWPLEIRINIFGWILRWLQFFFQNTLVKWCLSVLICGLCWLSLQGSGIGWVWPMILQALCRTEADSLSLWA